MKIQLHYPREQVISMMMNSGVTKSNSEAIYIGNTIYDMRKVENPIPCVRDSGYELIKKGLVSIGFFRKHMRHLTKQHGYPSTKYFTDRTITELIREGKRSIAEHFIDWTDFLYESFQPKIMAQEGIHQPAVYQRVSHHQAYPDHRQWKRPGFLSGN